MEKLRVYVDASVFGGYFDEEFKSETRPFLEAVVNSNAIAMVSDVLVGELIEAPERFQDLFEKVISAPDCERLETNEEVENLRDAYIKAKVLSARWSEDALHVAHASVGQADVLESWNFRHLVHPVRIRGFNEVNAVHGYRPIVIMTPEDVSHGWEVQGNETDE